MNHKKLFENNSIIVRGLCNLLDDANIVYLIKDKFESARLAGFGESSNAVEIHVPEDSFSEAVKIAERYKSEINS